MTAIECEKGLQGFARRLRQAIPDPSVLLADEERIELYRCLDSSASLDDLQQLVAGSAKTASWDDVRLEITAFLLDERHHIARLAPRIGADLASRLDGLAVMVDLHLAEEAPQGDFGSAVGLGHLLNDLATAPSSFSFRSIGRSFTKAGSRLLVGAFALLGGAGLLLGFYGLPCFDGSAHRPSTWTVSSPEELGVEGGLFKSETALGTRRLYRLAAGWLHTPPHLARAGTQLGMAFLTEEILVSGGGNGVSFWSLPRGTLLRCITEEKAFAVAVHRPSLRVAWCRMDNGPVSFIQYGSQDAPRRLKTNRSQTLSLAFTPDGNTLISGGNDRHVSLVRLFEDTPARRLPPWFGTAMAVSPQGSLLACGGYRGTVELCSLETEKRIGILKDGRSTVWELAFSPDGSTLAAAFEGNPGANLLVWNVKTRRLLPVHGQKGRTTSVSFSPDGRQLLTVVEGRLHMVDLSSGQTVFQSRDRSYWRAAFSPSGKRVAALSFDRIQLFVRSE